MEAGKPGFSPACCSSCLATVWLCTSCESMTLTTSATWLWYVHTCAAQSAARVRTLERVGVRC